MKYNDSEKQLSFPLSVFLTENFVLLYISIFAVLTILTHSSQFFHLVFSTYSNILFVLVLLIVIIHVRCRFIPFYKTVERDYIHAVGVFALCVFCGLISVFYHRIGRILPDEYYYGASPSFFLANPSLRMGYQIYSFYSKEIFFSVAYLTAGAYEYIQAALALLLGVRSFALIYYFVGACLTGFMICASYFLLIRWFTADSGWALMGTVGVICSIFLMGETSWSPGAYSFMRAFEGKSFLLFAGIPLFAYFSLIFFDSPSLSRGVNLFLLTTTLSGMSTSAIPMIPLLGFVLFLSYYLTYWVKRISFQRIVSLGILYLFSFSYLIFYGICIAYFDDRIAANYFNQAYSYPFMGYLMGFVYPQFPTTAILFVLFSLLIFFFFKKRKVVFLLLWMFLAIGLILNPVVSGLYLKYFTGIYFRFFYIVPFPLVAGLVVAYSGIAAEQSFFKAGRVLSEVMIMVFFILLLLLPTSIFRSANYLSGSMLENKEFVDANHVVSFAPKGVILAPYLISGAIQMIDGNYLPLVQRNDIIGYYLTIKKPSDGALRIRVEEFLTGKNDDYNALLEIVDKYPELRTIILYGRTYYEFEKKLNKPLNEMEFSLKKIGGLAVYWR